MKPKTIRLSKRDYPSEADVRRWHNEQLQQSAVMASTIAFYYPACETEEDAEGLIDAVAAKGGPLIAVELLTASEQSWLIGRALR